MELHILLYIYIFLILYAELLSKYMVCLILS